MKFFRHLTFMFSLTNKINIKSNLYLKSFAKTVFISSKYLADENLFMVTQLKFIVNSLIRSYSSLFNWYKQFLNTMPPCIIVWKTLTRKWMWKEWGEMEWVRILKKRLYRSTWISPKQKRCTENKQSLWYINKIATSCMYFPNVPLGLCSQILILCTIHAHASLISAPCTSRGTVYSVIPAKFSAKHV